MSRYFSYFPKILYSANSKSSSLETVTNITTRLAFESSLKENYAAFYEYEIKEGDTPEIIASKYYNNPERHWIVLLFNNIIDPQFDWPLDYNSFTNYIRSKYSLVSGITIENGGTGYSNGYITFTTVDGVGSGANAYVTVNASGSIVDVDIISRGSGYKQAPTANVYGGNNAVLTVTIPSDPIAWAKSNTHSYYKTITQTTNYFGVQNITVEKFEVDSNTYANNILMENGTNETYVLNDGSSVIIETTKKQKNYFEYEIEQNEKKRKIKLLRSEFVSEIEKEFKRKVK